MSNLNDTAFACLLTQHASEQTRQAQLDELARLQAANAKLRGKTRVSKPAAGTAKQYRNPAPAPIVMALPEKGTLDAESFLIAIRKAGQRTISEVAPNGQTIQKIYTNAREVRGDMIRAIAAYIGYDPRGNYGAQDTAARTKANREMNTRKVIAPGDRASDKSAALSLSGFVHGMPDYTAQALLNLRAQAEKEADLLIQYDKIGNKVGARIQRERLFGVSGIYAQIKAMGFEI